MKRTTSDEEQRQLLETQQYLLEYIYSMNFEVNLRSSWFAIFPEEQLITCNVRCRNEWLKTISIAHEAGHITATRPRYMKSWRKCKTAVHTAILHEEWAAWEHGWTLIDEWQKQSNIFTHNFYNTLQTEYWKCARISWNKYIQYIASAPTTDALVNAYW